jgi:microcystin-dependent protein
MARQPFNTRWAQGVETEDSLNSFKAPNDARVSAGWEGGQDKDAPPAGQENWWHNRVDSALQGVERQGVMTWHAQAIYGLGAPTYASDGNYYESLVADNSGNDPVSTSGFWRYCGSSFFTGHEPGDGKQVWHNGVPPAGWLKCNGAVLSRASYQRLFAVIGTAHNTGGETSLQFRLPDARGEFLRGFDDGRGVDVGRAFGSKQRGTLVTYDDPLTLPTVDTIRTTIANASADQVAQAEYPGTSLSYLTGPTSTPGLSSAGATRPRNITVNYWIKY